VFYKIQNAIVQFKDYTHLRMRCYICEEKGHLSLVCPRFKAARGNLLKRQGGHLFAPNGWNAERGRESSSEEGDDGRMYQLYGSEPES
jgi:hypothetical protein